LQPHIDTVLYVLNHEVNWSFT